MSILVKFQNGWTLKSQSTHTILFCRESIKNSYTFQAEIDEKPFGNFVNVPTTGCQKLLQSMNRFPVSVLVNNWVVFHLMLNSTFSNSSGLSRAHLPELSFSILIQFGWETNCHARMRKNHLHIPITTSVYHMYEALIVIWSWCKFCGHVFYNATNGTMSYYFPPKRIWKWL